MDANGENVANLSNNGASDYALGWSPDGDYILFYSDRDGNEDVWKMRAGGSEVVNLTRHPANERAASWSPDGTRILFNSDRHSVERELYTVDATGDGQQRLTFNKEYCESPDWSPGGQILFTRSVMESDSSENGEIFAMNSDQTGLVRLTNKQGFDSGGDWSPDGARIAFYGPSDKGNYDISG